MAACIRDSAPVTCDPAGNIFIDRSPDYFDVVLDLLQYGRLTCPPSLHMDRLCEELDFYGLTEWTSGVQSIKILSNTDLEELLDSQLSASFGAHMDTLKALAVGVSCALRRAAEGVDGRKRRLSVLFAVPAREPGDPELRRAFESRSVYCIDVNSQRNIGKAVDLLPQYLQTRHSLTVKITACRGTKVKYSDSELYWQLFHECATYGRCSYDHLEYCCFWKLEWQH